MTGFRIPLDSFPTILPAELESVTLRFGASTGDLIIDDIRLTN